MDCLQYKKLEKLANQLKEESGSFYNLQKSDIIDTWNKSVYYNKLSNQFKEDEELINDPIYQFHARCEELEGLKYYNITARHNFTRLDFFKLFILFNSLFLTYQEGKRVFNKELKEIETV